MSTHPAVQSNPPAPVAGAAGDGIAAQKLRPSVVRRLIRHIRTQFPVCLVGVSLAAAIVRATVRDGLLGLAMFYYATPPVIVAGLLLVAGGIWLLRRRWPPAAGCTLAALVCLLWWQQTMWFHNLPASDASGDLRVLCWNTARGWCGWEPAAREIRRQNADLVGLVEAGCDTAAMARLWHQYLPHYNVFTFDSGIALLSRFPVRPVRRGSLAQRGRYEHCEVRVGNATVQLVVVDLRGEPLHPRRPPLEALTAVLAPLTGQPVIVMGDFNTPTDSVFLADLRRSYVNAFEVAGNGYAATWPALAPVLTIDHVWVGTGLEVDHCALGTSWASDHRWVEARITIE